MDNVKNVMSDGAARVRNMELGQRLGLSGRKIRCGSVGPLGWMETLIKTLAVIIALTSIADFTTDREDISFPGLKIAIIWLIGTEMVIHVLWLVVKVLDREIHSIVTGVFQVVGLVVLFVMLFNAVDIGVLVITFCFLNIMGDYIKLMFLFVSDSYSPLWLKKPAIYGITLLLIVINFIINILQLEYWYGYYD